MGESLRKQRSDKKIDCKPTISIGLKECIYRISYITYTPVKDVAEKICLTGLRSKKVLDILSNHFRRDFRVNNTYYIGDFQRESLQKQKINAPTERISIRFTQQDFEIIRALAYALDVTPSKAVAILLDVTIHETNFIDRLAKNYLRGQVHETRLKELKKIIDYLNKHNSEEEKISWGALLSYLYDELKLGTNTLNKTISKWIHNLKS